MNTDQVLIAPKPFEKFEPEEFHNHVRDLYSYARKKSASPAVGLSISRTKKGGVSIRKSKARAFEYVTRTEIEALAKHTNFTIGEVWNAFVERGYLITKDRLEAEQINNAKAEIPW